MKKRNRKAIIDDGMNSELVIGAQFDGVFEIPIIKRPQTIVIPQGITPFTMMERHDINEEAIGFYEMDYNFSEVLIAPQDYIESFSRAKAFISPDCSLYRDAPLTVQIANVYRNRAIGYYYQKQGLYVIPQVRWGNDLTYTTKVLPEKVAFLGVQKHSIVAIGTYGCSGSRENKYYFKAGLESMLETLEPEVVLVYGAMPAKIFDEYKKLTKFIHYPDWTTRKKAGN